MQHLNKSKTCLFQRSFLKERKRCWNWRNYQLLVQDEYNERASIRTFNKFWVDKCFVWQSEVSATKLSRFCEEELEHRNLSLSWEISTSHSAIEIRRNLQRPVLRSSLIPERMELGIFAGVNFPGEVTPREVVRSRSKVEVSLNSKKCSPRQLGLW